MRGPIPGGVLAPGVRESSRRELLRKRKERKETHHLEAGNSVNRAGCIFVALDLRLWLCFRDRADSGHLALDVNIEQFAGSVLNPGHLQVTGQLMSCSKNGSQRGNKSINSTHSKRKKLGAKIFRSHLMKP